MTYFLKKRKWMAWLVLLTFLFTSFMPTNLLAGNSVAEAATANLVPDARVYDQTGKEITPASTDELADGQVRVKKTAEAVSGEYNTYTVTLEVEGKGVTVPQPGADIVLILDTSGSMGSQYNDAMGEMKTSAKDFLDIVLPDNTSHQNRVALVTFSTKASARDFSNDKSKLKSKIESLKADGGTNTQAALYKARKLLETSKATNKYLVIMTDGTPTYNIPTILDFNADDFTRKYGIYQDLSATLQHYENRKISFDYSKV